ncbi:Candidapepsin-5 [Yarrowia sp. C11]|nr:Candidapepsin-5 [Yarrowia sp. C11]KAG5370651.1 Candidapepsin-5 [Yarrowia sp. E02]
MKFSLLAVAVYALGAQAAVTATRTVTASQEQAVSSTLAVSVSETNSPKSGPIVASLKNELTFYTTELELGSPAQKFRLLLDTGSSDTWVVSMDDDYDCGYGSCDYTGQFTKNKSSSFRDLEQDFAFYYLGGNAKGKWATEELSFAGKKVSDFQFGLADSAFGVDPLTGILGVGPKSLESVKDKYSNLPEALKEGGYINKKAYSLYLGDDDGHIIFGGYDKAKFEGELVEHKMTDEKRIQVDYSNVRVSGVLCSPDEDSKQSAVLDTGSVLSYLDDLTLNRVFMKMPVFVGDYMDAQGAYQIQCMPPQFDISFKFGNQDIHVNGSDLIIPVSRNWSDLDDGCYFGITTNNNSNHRNILGAGVLRSVYTVVDLEDKTVSLAPVKKTKDSDVQELK